MPLRPRRPTRRQATAAVAATGAVVVLTFITTGTDGASASGSASRTATAELRDLRVTDADRGTLARSDTTTILYDGTGGRSDGGPAGSILEAQSSPQATRASLTPDPTPDPKPDPCAPPSPSATSSTVTPAPSTTCAPTTSTTRPTTTTTTAPSTEPPPAVEEPPATDPPPSVDEQPTGPQQPGGTLPPGDDPQGPQGPQVSGGPSRATLTELLAVGETATRGSVLYRADDEPIVALLSATPLFRELRVGVTDGPDVQAIESELQALGYSGFTVDDHYDARTAAAVERWETDLGRAALDGVVTVGEVRLLEEPTAVLEHTAQVGDLLEPDDAVMVLGAESRIIEADVAAEEAADWAVGTAVEIGWADGTTTSGSVVEVGRDVTDSEVPIVIALEPGTRTEAPIGSRVDVVRTVAERTGVVAVPVSAVVQGEDGPVVRVVGTKRDEPVAVELGIVDDGWVEVTKGLEEGTEVRLPG